MSERIYAPRSGGRATEPRDRREPQGKGQNPDSVRDRTVADNPGRRAATLGGRGRRPATDAPVDGSAALQIEVTAGEPLRVADPAIAPRLRVAPPAPISAPRAPFIAVMIGVVIAGVLGILLINTKTNENAFKIADLQKQDSALDSQQQDLENQLVEASSIGNLDAAARRLGLVKADSPALIRLPDGKLIGVLTPTAGKPAVTAQDAKTATGAATGTGTNTDPNTDKGAANIVPATGAAQPNDLTPNGTVPTAAMPDSAVTTGNGQ